MRSVNSIRGSDDSEVLTSMNDRTLIQLLFSDALTHVKKHQLTLQRSFEREFQMRNLQTGYQNSEVQNRKARVTC